MRFNNRTILAAVVVGLLLGVASFAAADDASVVYLEGDPELRRASGGTDWIDFGSVLRSGDSVVTGRSDFVELEQGAAATIRVNANTVFTIREVERGGQRETVMSNSVGSVGYRFSQVAGRREPRVGTSTTVAGVRGTELTIFAGADGSSLFVVESGEVEVTSAGQSVSLLANEGVEVPAGGPPGEKFEIIGRAVDFAEWNEGKFEQFLADPVAAVEGVGAQLREYYAELDELRGLYADARERYDVVYADLLAAVEEHGRESSEADEIRTALDPLINETTVHFFNIRYYGLTALSLRRHVLGQMYVQMRSRNILNTGDPTYRAFLAEYQEIIREFEERATEELVAVDI